MVVVAPARRSRQRPEDGAGGLVRQGPLPGRADPHPHQANAWDALRSLRGGGITADRDGQGARGSMVLGLVRVTGRLGRAEPRTGSAVPMDRAHLQRAPRISHRGRDRAHRRRCRHGRRRGPSTLPLVRRGVATSSLGIGATGVAVVPAGVPNAGRRVVVSGSPPDRVTAVPGGYVHAVRRRQ